MFPGVLALFIVLIMTRYASGKLLICQDDYRCNSRMRMSLVLLRGPLLISHSTPYRPRDHALRQVSIPTLQHEDRNCLSDTGLLSRMSCAKHFSWCQDNHHVDPRTTGTACDRSHQRGVISIRKRKVHEHDVTLTALFKGEEIEAVRGRVDMESRVNSIGISHNLAL